MTVLLLYPQRDLEYAAKLKDHRYRWLMELGAIELSETGAEAEGFLFSYDFGAERYAALVEPYPQVLDRPADREPLTRLDTVLQRLAEHHIDIPTPRTWAIGVDDELPENLTFPLFLRTAKSSWKRGGSQSRVANRRELREEMELLRRVFGWDSLILAREWLDVAAAGSWMYGDAPQEIRVWIVDQQPVAWSFHYLHAVPHPVGFPPASSDLMGIQRMAGQVGSAFQSRLMVADFLRDRSGRWHFLEAGPGSMAGTAHEAIFKAVAERLRGGSCGFSGNAVGGIFLE